MNLLTISEISDKHGVPVRTLQDRASKAGMVPKETVAGVTLWSKRQARKLVRGGKRGRPKGSKKDRPASGSAP